MDEDLLVNEPRIDGTVIKKNKSKDLGLIKVLRVPKNAKALKINKNICRCGINSIFNWSSEWSNLDF